MACLIAPVYSLELSLAERKLEKDRDDRILMIRLRTIFVLLLSLVAALAPIASVAMTKPCAMAVEMTSGNPADCPCGAFMPDCKLMPQCRTAVGCVNHCYVSSAILTNIVGPPTLARPAAPIRYAADLRSLRLRPPTPPPRA